MRKDLFCALVLLIVAGAYYAFTTEIPESLLADEVGPTGLPTILSILLVVAAIAIGARALVAAPAPAAPKAEKEQEASVLRAFGMLGIGALYVLLVSVLGYFLSLALVLIAVPLYEGKKPSWQLFVIALTGAGLFWFLFNSVLGVRQPAGLFF